MKFIACSRAPNLLREMFDNLQSLVGETVEIAGPVEEFCGRMSGNRIVDRNQIRILR